MGALISTIVPATQLAGRELSSSSSSSSSSASSPVNVTDTPDTVMLSAIISSESGEVWAISSPVPLDVPPTSVELNQFSLRGSEDTSSPGWYTLSLKPSPSEAAGVSPIRLSPPVNENLPCPTQRNISTVIRVGSFGSKRVTG